MSPSELFRKKKQFQALVSHELQTPLNGILGLADLLMEEIPPEKESNLRGLKDLGLKLSNSISRILDLNKIYGQELILQSGKFQPSEFMRKMESKFQVMKVETLFELWH